MLRTMFLAALTTLIQIPATAGSGVQPPPAAQAGMVQPESLPQGFILVVSDKGGTATSDSPIFVASNHNGWNPGDQGQKLTPRSDRRWQIVLPKPKLDSRMAFKFTRGSWDNVEVSDKFEDVENRTLPLVDASKLKPGEQPIIELEIKAFRDQRPWEPALAAANPYREIKATGTIRRLEVVGGGTSVVRDLLVWLPPGYDDAANAQRRYPVLYLQDGQNVFEKPPTAPGEWEADETATKLIAEKSIEPLIIVGIPTDGVRRRMEYVPIEVFDNSPAQGDAYTEFLVREVVPRVDRSFRTRASADSRVIGGSSLGAAISLYAAAKHPEVFGKVLAESPALQVKGRAMFKQLETFSKWPDRVYIGMGGREMENEPASSEVNQSYVQLAKDLDAMLKAKGIADGSRMLVIEPEAVHNEGAWAKRLPGALKFLVPAR